MERRWEDKATTSLLAIVHAGVKPHLAFLNLKFIGQVPGKDDALLNNLENFKDLKRKSLEDPASQSSRTFSIFKSNHPSQCFNSIKILISISFTFTFIVI